MFEYKLNSKLDDVVRCGLSNRRMSGTGSVKRCSAADSIPLSERRGRATEKMRTHDVLDGDPQCGEPRAWNR